MKITSRKSSKNKYKLDSTLIRLGRENYLVLEVFNRIYSIDWSRPLSFKARVYNTKVRYRRLRDRLTHWYRMNFDKNPIYFSLWSRDCDMCESTAFGKSSTYREHHEWLNNPDEWDWVEGATSVDEISREEWQDGVKSPRRVRDRVMEAYENGRVSSIYV